MGVMFYRVMNSCLRARNSVMMMANTPKVNESLSHNFTCNNIKKGGEKTEVIMRSEGQKTEAIMRSKYYKTKVIIRSRVRRQRS